MIINFIKHEKVKCGAMVNLKNQHISNEKKSNQINCLLQVVGLGYVGLRLAYHSLLKN